MSLRTPPMITIRHSHMNRGIRTSRVMDMDMRTIMRTIMHMIIRRIMFMQSAQSSRMAMRTNQRHIAG